MTPTVAAALDAQLRADAIERDWRELRDLAYADALAAALADDLARITVCRCGGWAWDGTCRGTCP